MINAYDNILDQSTDSYFSKVFQEDYIIEYAIDFLNQWYISLLSTILSSYILSTFQYLLYMWKNKKLKLLFIYTSNYTLKLVQYKIVESYYVYIRGYALNF